ncbi:MAG: TonB-dependent receptor, partial [Gammaproteobacteria bacterium]|nr:TonB-dependent receptor [Gammaproteobacteria bacterium]
TIPWVPLRDIENPDQGLLFPPVYNTGNPDLEPEISTTLAVGFDWSPGGALDGLSLQVTWFDVEFKDKFGSGFSIFRNQPELMFEIPRMIIRDEFGNIARVNLFTVNLARRFSEYLDASLRYDFDTGRWGNFSLGADGTYTSLLRDVSFAGADPTDLHGTPTGPERWKANGYVSWLQGDVALTVTARYSSSYAGFFYSPQERVENYLTWDLTGSYEFGNSGWKIYAGARNITDAEFPFFDGLLYPWDARRVDTRGRILHFEIRKSYDIF